MLQRYWRADLRPAPRHSARAASWDAADRQCSSCRERAGGGGARAVAGHGRAEDQRTLDASGYDPHTDRRQRGGACHGSALAKRFDAQHRAKVFPRGGRRRGRVHLPKARCIGCQRLKRPPADDAVSGRRAARQERRRGGQKGVKGPCTVSRGKNVSPEGEEARRAGTVSRGKNVQIGEHRGDADVDGKAAAVRGDAEARGARARGGVREPPLLVLGLEDRARGGLGVGAARRRWGVRRAACGVRGTWRSAPPTMVTTILPACTSPRGASPAACRARGRPGGAGDAASGAGERGGAFRVRRKAPPAPALSRASLRDRYSSLSLWFCHSRQRGASALHRLGSGRAGDSHWAGEQHLYHHLAHFGVVHLRQTLPQQVCVLPLLALLPAPAACPSHATARIACRWAFDAARCAVLILTHRRRFGRVSAPRTRRFPSQASFP